MIIATHRIQALKYFKPRYQDEYRYGITPPILLLALLNRSTIKQMAGIIKIELSTQQLNKILETQPSTYHIGFFKRLFFKLKLLRQKNNL